MTKLSDTQRVILSKAAQHGALLAERPAKLPAAARNAVLRSLLAKGMLAEVPAPREAEGLAWRQHDDGAWIALRITDAGLQAIGVEPADHQPDDDHQAHPQPTSPAEAALAPATGQAEVRATGAEAMVAHLKLLIAKLKHDRFGASSERGSKLIDQLELELGELVAAVSEDATKAENAGAKDRSSTGTAPRRQAARAPLPEHLPRERVVIAAPSACPYCGGRLSKLGEDITETLEVIPRQWKVIQTVRERFSCRSCETITQPPAPFHPIARGRAGPQLLAMILEAKFGQHLPLNRLSEIYAREGIQLSVSTIADWVGTCTASLTPLMLRIYAAMAQKERELISERTRAALAAAKARGKVLGGDRGYRPAAGPDIAAAARQEAANRAAHRLHLELEHLRTEGVEGHAALARALNARGIPTPRGRRGLDPHHGGTHRRAHWALLGGTTTGNHGEPLEFPGQEIYVLVPGESHAYCPCRPPRS